jgi:hypothetical protein
MVSEVDSPTPYCPLDQAIAQDDFDICGITQEHNCCVVQRITVSEEAGCIIEFFLCFHH